MKTQRTRAFDWMIALAAFVLATTLLTGCQTGEVITKGDRFLEDYVAARQDGKIDAAEIAVLDRDAADLDDAQRRAPAFTLPPTGNPLLDTLVQILVPIGIAGVTGVATHKYTMSVRDRLASAKAPEDTPTPTPPA